MTHPINLWHGDANYLMITGTLLSKELVHPTVGSVVALKKGDPNALPLAEGCGRARILTPTPTNRELRALCKRDRYSTAEKFLDPKEHMVTVCGKCYTDTDEPVTGGLLTEIM
jgi:hypothetical protein